MESLMQSDFSPEYAYHLGYKDGREYGTKHPHRSFSRESNSEREKAYFRGLDRGVYESWRYGLEVKCTVHWDNPGFHTPACNGKATHVATWESNGDATLFLCSKHALVAQFLHEPAKPAHWAVVPIAWL